MNEQRERARRVAGRGRGGEELRDRALALAGQAGFETDFVGYETTESETSIGAVDRARATSGRVLVKLVESPFYATGGGQVADSGYVECFDGDCRARVDDVLRLGDDQVVALVPERGTIEPGERVTGDRRPAPPGTRPSATTPPRTCCTPRCGGASATHVRQAGSYVGPDKLRFDFTHGKALTDEELRDVEEMVNAWVLEDQPVRALTTTIEEARRLGAMALFGEKYGDVVRMVEVGDGSFSRELCGGTHVRFTAEIGLFKIVTETSSAANVRRIEALTGPEAVGLRAPSRRGAGAGRARAARHSRAGARAGRAAARVASASSSEAAARRAPSAAAVDLEQLLGEAYQHDGATVLASAVPAGDGKALLQILDRLKGKLGDAAIVLGARRRGPSRSGRERRSGARRARPARRGDREGGGRGRRGRRGRARHDGARRRP